MLSMTNHIKTVSIVFSYTFGSPVVPDVYKIYKGSFDSMGTQSIGSAFCIIWSHVTSCPGMICPEHYNENPLSTITKKLEFMQTIWSIDGSNQK